MNIDRAGTVLAICIILLTTPPSFADKEAGNRTHVTASDYGGFYLKSIPSELYGLAGRTEIYQVSDTEDILLHTYDWYSPEAYIYAFSAGPIVYVVQFGPWHRGHEADPEHLAVAFHKNGELLKEYSTLDIVGKKNNVSASVSHYTVFQKKLGFRRPWGNQIVFDVVLHNGATLTFNMDTGEIMRKEDERAAPSGHWTLKSAAERFRILGDFNLDGREDMALSEDTAHFSNAGGYFEVYLRDKNDLLQEYDSLFLHPKAISVEKLGDKVRLWTYHRAGGWVGSIGYYTFTKNGFSEFESMTIYSGDGGTPLGNAVYRAVMDNSDADFKIEKSSTSDNHEH